MADLGVEVELIPQLDAAKFRSLVEGLKLKIPIEVDPSTISNSIDKAVSSSKQKKVKVDADTSALQRSLKNATRSAAKYSRADNTMKQLLPADIRSEYDKMEKAVKNLGSKGAFNSGSMKQLRDEFSSASKGLLRVTNTAEQQGVALNKVSAAYQNIIDKQKELSSSGTGIRRIQRESQHLFNLQRQARQLIENNPRVAGTSIYGNLQEIIGSASSGSKSSVELSRDLAQARSEMERLGVTSESVGQRVRRLFHDHFNTAIAMAGVHLLQNTLQDVVQSVIDVDTAMTDLQKVSNATSSDYATFLDGAEGRAKSLGATVTDVIGATSEFSRLGYNLEESSTLGDAAVKYLNVSEYTNIEDAAQSLVSTMQAFGMGADEVGSIVDKFNEIGNNYAISSEGLGEAMQRSAASLAGAGNSLDESLALVTAANEVVQDPDVVGTWAKTLTMYLRAAEVDAEAAGIETEGMAHSVSELRDSILSLTDNKVDIMEDDTNYKNTVQIMREIASVYDDMSDIDQAALLELISGKRQANTTAALIGNWQQVENAIQSAQNSLGSADAENEKYLNSIEGHLQQFQAQYQATTTSIIDSDFMKGTIDFGSGILGAVQWLTENLGAIPGLITPILSLLGSTQNFNLLTTKRGVDGSTSILGPMARWKEYSESLKQQTEADKIMLRDYLNMTNDVAAVNDKAKVSDIDFERTFATGSQNVKNVARSYDTVKRSVEEVNAEVEKFGKQQAQINSFSAKLGNAAKNFGANLLASFGSMAAWTAIVSAISAVVNLFDRLTMSAEEAATVTQDVVQGYQQTSAEIDNNISSMEDLSDRYDELSKGVSDTGQNVSLSTTEYEEYRNIVSQIASLAPSLIEGYNAEGDAIIAKNDAIERTIELLEQQRAAEARQTVYGGSNVNDGGLTNFQTAYLDFENQYNEAFENVRDQASSVTDELKAIYSESIKGNAGATENLKDAIGDAIGLSYEDFIEQQRRATGKSPERLGKEYAMGQYFDRNYASIAENMPQILNNLRDMGLLTQDVASRANGVYQEYLAAEEAVDGTASSLREMMQAVFESRESYTDLGDGAKGFLEMFRQSVSPETLKFLGSDGARELAESLSDGLADNPQVRSAAAEMYDMITDQDNIPIGEFTDRIRALSDVMQSELGVNIDFADALGLDEFESQVSDLASTVQNSLNEALEGVEVTGTIGGEELKKSVEEMISGLDLEDLSIEQLETLQQVMASAGDRATEFASRLLAINEAGALPGVLNEISEAVGHQAGEFQSVAASIQEYQAGLANLEPTARSTHESLAAIYEETAEAVERGDINNERVQYNLEYLTGQEMGLDEARKWISQNKGLFTVADEDNLVGDFTDMWATLRSRYNALSEEQQKQFNNLARVDFDTGGIQVAGNDVERLAEVLGWSEPVLQHFLDYTREFSDQVPSDMSAAGDAIQTLNDDVYRLSKSLTDSQKVKPIWDELTVPARDALEDFAENMNLDPTEMNFDQVENLVASLNTLKAALGENITTEALVSGLQGIKTAAGEAAVAVQEVSDTEITVDVTDISAIATAWNATEDQVRQALAAVSGQIQNMNGQTITFTVNGQPAIDTATQTAEAADNAMANAEEAHQINVDNRAALQSIAAVKTSMAGVKSREVTIKVNTVNTTTNRVINSVSTSSSGSYTPSGTLDPLKDPSSVIFGRYAGVTGKMRNMAIGGQSRGGRTLVGELGPELWISRDGKHQRVVGKNGMEVIRMKAGDAIVPANYTAALIRGGMSSAWQGSGGSFGSALQNALSNAGGGSSSYYTGSSYKNTKPTTTTVKVQADTSDAEESMEEALEKLKEEIDDIVGNLEHEIFLLTRNDGSLGDILARYKKIQSELNRQANKFREKGLDENSDYIQDLQKQWWDAQDSMAEAVAEFYETPTAERENAITLTENWLENAINAKDVAKTQEYTNDIINYYRQLQDIYHDQAEQYRALGFSDVSDEVSELSDAWWEAEYAITDAKQQIIDSLSDIVSETSDAIDDLQDVFDTLKDAADEYAETGGYISVDSFQAIMELGPQYMQYLRDENGLLVINEENIKKVIAAKTEQLALDNAMAYVERLRMALQEGSIEDLNTLLYATEAATDATWGFLYAQLALLGLDANQYQAALHNMQAMQSLAENAKLSVGIDFDSMKSGVDDLLDYVMDMVRDEVEEQIDALDDLKDKFAEIVDLQKEALDNAREEDDYRDTVNEKLKELAELQSKINDLSLDDSRWAQGEKARLEEELADLQKELSDYQADYAYDKQVDSLDKMQEAYEDQKDKEIEKLEESISSQQKIYEMAYLIGHSYSNVAQKTH